MHSSSLRALGSDARTRGPPRPHRRVDSPVSDEEFELLVNCEPRRIPANCTVTGLLDRLEINGRRIAVAINRDVVPRSTFERHRLREGDRVEILEAVGGG